MDLQSGYPYSLIRNGLPYNYPWLERDIRLYVAVIGGGISGALTAYALYKHEVFLNVVADARTIGLGGTMVMIPRCYNMKLIRLYRHYRIRWVLTNCTNRAYMNCR